MKSSKFNLFIEKEGRMFIYNQLRSSLLEIDEELFQAIGKPDFDADKLSEDILDELYENGMVCEDSLCEENVILAQTKLRRFSESFARGNIHTVLLNFYKDEPMEAENNLRFIRWEMENGNRPANLGPEHFKFLCAGKIFFARKMTTAVSYELMEKIDDNLIDNYEKNKRFFNYEQSTAEGIVDIFRALSVDSVLVVGNDSLLYVDALLGKDFTANGLVQAGVAMEWAKLFNIEEYCQFVDRNEPLEVDKGDLYDSLLLVNQLARISPGNLLAEICRLSVLTDKYVLIVESTSEEKQEQELYQTIANSCFLMIPAINKALTHFLKDEKRDMRIYLLMKNY